MHASATRFALVCVAAGLLLSGCREVIAPSPPAADRDTGPLEILIDREWEWRLEQSPLFATGIGDHRFDDRLPEMSFEAIAARADDTQGFLDELHRIDRTTLSGPAGIDRDMFEQQLRERVEAFRFGEHLLPINADSGFHTSFALLPQGTPYASVDDYEKYLARLRAFPRYVDQQIALMREGLRTGMTISRAALAGIETSIEPLAADDIEGHPLWQPFERIPSVVDAPDRDRLRDEGRAAMTRDVIPAYRAFLAFMTTEYVPGARETLGASELPDGRAYYDWLVRKFTTLDLTADEVHARGLEEVAAIRAEMETVMRQTDFTGSFDAFLQFLRTDPRFYPTSGEQLLKEASFIAKRMDAKLPSLFGRLPRQPYGVAPVPEYLAPKYTAGRYSGNPPGGTEPGYYWVNTYALHTRPLYNLEALTLHEAVPGHHLQIALAGELESVPNFRKHTYISAFGEGWGLYAEWLGLEAGFYTDPYSNFGRLTYAMWRAARLVVDTGLHARGWTRQQAIDYLASNTALSLHECTTEVDRYISWPGQALSYKIGELKIRELRARAERELGAAFDIRAFHDAVLAHGSVPLPVLEQVVDEFIGGQVLSHSGPGLWLHACARLIHAGTGQLSAVTAGSGLVTHGVRSRSTRVGPGGEGVWRGSHTPPLYMRSSTRRTARPPRSVA
jgi:uncharacterized protein (DUF885 family)